MRKNGFTLIELLVVIAIIGILSTIVTVALNTARGKARDAKRIQEIRQLQTVLDMYYSQNGSYPASASCGATSPNNAWCNSAQSLSGGHWIKDNGSGNLSAYINVDPVDPTANGTANWTPVGGNTYFYFSYGGSERWYMIVYGLERSGSIVESSDGVTSCDGTYYHFGDAVNNIGIVTVGRSCQGN